MLNYNLSPTTGEVREFRDGRFNASREPTDYEKQLFEEIEKLKKENQELSNRLEKLVSQPSEPSCENCKWHSTDHETCMNRINWDKLNRKVPIYIPDIIAKIISCKQFEQP